MWSGVAPSPWKNSVQTNEKDMMAERVWATPAGGDEVAAAVLEGDVARMLVLCKKKNFRDCGAFAQAGFTCLCSACGERGRLTYEQWIDLL